MLEIKITGLEGITEAISKLADTLSTNGAIGAQAVASLENLEKAATVEASTPVVEPQSQQPQAQTVPSAPTWTPGGGDVVNGMPVVPDQPVQQQAPAEVPNTPAPAAPQPQQGGVIPADLPWNSAPQGQAVPNVQAVPNAVPQPQAAPVAQPVQQAAPAVVPQTQQAPAQTAPIPTVEEIRAIMKPILQTKGPQLRDLLKKYGVEQLTELMNGQPQNVNNFIAEAQAL